MSVAAEDPSVGALLRTWRERRRFSQQELSNRSRVSTRHLSRVETGDGGHAKLQVGGQLSPG